MKRIITLLYICVLALPMFAQLSNEEKAKIGQGEINRQAEFFDPTRKEKKEKEVYKFSVDYRLELGYVQEQQRSEDWRNPFLHGAKIGFTVDFNLPYHFSIQTGLSACAAYGRIDQHWRSLNQESVQKEYVRHGFNPYFLELPVRAYYNQKLWKDLNMFFFAGPKVQIGLAQLDFVHEHLSEPAHNWLLSEGVLLENHDRYAEGELRRTNLQFGLGGGMEWDRYRLVAGYDFGLNNLLRQPGYRMNQWGWYVSFAYKL